MMATGCLSRIWFAQRWEVEDCRSVMHSTSLIGRPPMPFRYVLTYLTAASSARRTSGNATGPESSFRRPNTIGLPLAGFAFPSGSAVDCAEETPPQATVSAMVMSTRHAPTSRTREIRCIHILLVVLAIDVRLRAGRGRGPHRTA